MADGVSALRRMDFGLDVGFWSMDVRVGFWICDSDSKIFGFLGSMAMTGSSEGLSENEIAKN